jgi:predicted nucleic acid-binding protein
MDRTAKVTIVSVAVLLVLIAVMFYVPYVILKEVTNTKKELVQKAKQIDEKDVAKGIAGAMHKVKSFKKDIKTEMTRLDSLDSTGGSGGK